MRKTMMGLAVALSLGAIVASQATAATPVLTSSQQAQLKYLVEEEKLARDVYTYLQTATGLNKFRNIARSEQDHMNLVSGILQTYGITNPTTGAKAGVFTDSNLAALYKKLIASGSVDYAGAMAAGVAIEKLDIADLKTDIKAETAPDVLSVLNTLLRGSENHLAAFSR